MPTMSATAVVTGGTGGLGTAVVSRLRAEGWQVVVPWVAARELERLPGRQALAPVEADVASAEGVAKVTAAAEAVAVAEEAPLRGLVNLVGGFSSGPRVHETPLQEFESQFALNVRTAFMMTQATLPALLRSGEGSVVCVGSRAARQPFSGAAAYAASKAAVIAFAQAVAVEYRDEGLRSNVVLPSVIDTPANRAAMPKADHSRWVTPEQIAEVIAFLLSPASASLSGAEIPVYGRA